MKKMMMMVTMVLLFSLGSWPEIRKEQQYVNLSFTVWQLEDGAVEAARRINIPIPQVYSDSWICDFITFDISNGKTATKLIEKDGFRFVLTAELKMKLTIQVFEKDVEIFRFVHNRPSTVDYIFYGSDGMTYLMELTYTADNQPIGLLSPGILKK